MKNFLIATAIAAVLVIPALPAGEEPAPAPPKKPVIATRKQAQQKRIAEGVASGELTTKEAARIKHKEAALNREIHRKRKANGGKLTPKQKAKVTHEQNHLSREIAKEKHDAQQAPK